MTTQDNGTAENPAGEAKDPVDSSKSDVVPREHARKLLDEKKKAEKELAELKAKLDVLEADKQSVAEQKLAEEKKWQELAQKRDEEKQKLQQELKKRDEIADAMKRERDEEKKRISVLEELGCKFKKPQYEKFLDISEAPDDPVERKEWVAKFKAENADLLVVQNVTPPPATAPRSGSSHEVKTAKNLEELRPMLDAFNAKIYEKTMGKSAQDLLK